MSSFAQLTYTGGLHVECEHLQSGVKIMTHSSDKADAQLDSFSPVDLCAVSMAACACTMMGLFAENHNLDITGMKVQVQKEMKSKPYRFGKLEVIFEMPDRGFTDKDKTQLERAARTCPVHVSLHPEIEQIYTFHWAN